MMGMAMPPYDAADNGLPSRGLPIVPPSVRDATPERDALATALRYISSPTMGLPGGGDALDFVDECAEKQVRATLATCIGMARAALAHVREPSDDGNDGGTVAVNDDGLRARIEALCEQREKAGRGVIIYPFELRAALAGDSETGQT